ncbi:MAG: hypothetical protein OXI12_11185 [Gammaproteobacteria bacterium]|nr:hypothetical protein [Gammaproteobacteria bacterium]
MTGVQVEIVTHSDIHGRRTDTRLQAHIDKTRMEVSVGEARSLWSQLGDALATIDEQAEEVAQ